MQSVIECVSASATTSGTTQDLTISGFGTVVGCYIELSLATADGTSVSHGMISTGIWDGTNARCKSFLSRHGVATTDTYESNRNDRILVVLNTTTGAILRYATISAVTDGIRLTWDGTPATAWKISAQFYGGTALQAKVIDLTGPTAIINGATTTTSVGFQSDALIFLGNGSYGTGSPAASANLMVGFATRSPSILNACMSWSDPDAQVTSATTMWASDTMCGIVGTDGQMAVTAFSSNGFTVSSVLDDGGSDAPNTAVLCLRCPGISMWCGSISSPTSTGIVTHDPGFKMQAALLGCTGATALDTQQNDDSSSAVCVSMVGGRTGTPTSRFALAREQDGQTLSVTASLTSTPVTRMVMGSGTSMYTGSWSSWPDSGIAVNWTATNATSRKLIMLAFGAETIQPSGIATAEAFGTPTMVRGTVTVSPSGIATAEAFGTPVVVAGAVIVSPTGIATAEAFGTPTLVATHSVLPGGIATAEAFGTPVVVAGAVIVSPSGIATAEAFGTPVVVAGAVTIDLDTNGILSAEAFGTPSLTAGVVVIDVTGIDSAEAFGTPTITAGVVLVVSGIASEEAFGTPVVVAGAVTIDLDGDGIESAEAFGLPELLQGVFVIPTGIASAEAFGNATIVAGVVTIDLDGDGIESAEAFGTPVVVAGAVTIDLDTNGILSAEAFGTPSLTAGVVVIDLDTNGIPSAEAFGNPALIAEAVTIIVNAIASEETFGTPTLLSAGGQTIAVVGIASGEAFGVPVLLSNQQIVQPFGIESAEAFGLPFLSGGFIPVTLKKKIHDALCQAAELGTFIRVTYDSEACEIVQGPQVQPGSIEINELTQAYQISRRHGRKFLEDFTDWNWLMILKFDQEVICDPFVRRMLEDPICITRDEDDDRQVRLALVDTQYEHPPREGASNGTLARFRIQAELSPR